MDKQDKRDKKDYVTIDRFDHVYLDHGALLLLDVDETLIYYRTPDGQVINRKWWERTFDKHFEKNNDYEHAEAEALQEWEATIARSDPFYTDDEIHRFLRYVEDKRARVCLVTARRRELGDLTRDHLRRLGFPETDIIYCEGNCKAAAIRRRFENLEEYSHVVFVDDLEFNVLGVANEHPRFSCYLYDRSFD